MIVVSTCFEVYAIKKNTNAVFFKELRTGSKIKITVGIQKTLGGNPSSVVVENLDSKERISRGIGELALRLESFDLREIKEV